MTLVREQVVLQCSSPGLGYVVRAKVADTVASRMIGMLLTPRPRLGYGVLLSPCWAVHTLGMCYPIDVVFLDADMRITSIHVDVPPGRLMVGDRRAKYTLEVAAGTATSFAMATGQHLREPTFFFPPHGIGAG